MERSAERILGLIVLPAPTLVGNELGAILAGGTRPITLEVTEHQKIEDHSLGSERRRSSFRHEVAIVSAAEVPGRSLGGS